MSDEQIESIINHEIALEDSHPRGEKPKCFDEIIEQDGSIHKWFDKQETLNGYYHIFFQILIDYDIPYKFLTDNRTLFNYISLNPDKRTS